MGHRADIYTSKGSKVAMYMYQVTGQVGKLELKFLSLATLRNGTTSIFAFCSLTLTHTVYDIKSANALLIDDTV